MSAQQNGIVTLLKAEKEAQEIVSEARKYRQEKLKQAKIDAANEINNYKATKDNELKEFEQKNGNNVAALESESAEEIKKELDEVKKLSKEKEGTVVDLLVKAITQPVSEMHVNAA
ncbi:hypothetical protein TPHA_0E01390 [Tetrapisispora phaffii CBS 4417]|uniref:V-type proton ATPase subunit G n=1 Tax=Tetrapisispora phaffii (strain ATCC 24235 / CBS 4417 / NBRC 1672 / NRRL Y-8282 / UCD 70-5) TaxID=1071381 RepID=G8BTK6_TETPH|nr:hypothetical protein TPHA_0E01390 [Tetrapisispora phaffii CBS 4417]CCE63234.1 hypothetical protein TPHA_0E01390 [Tetrapisispora phaffii CBS 4417]